MAKHSPYPTEFEEQVKLIQWCNCHPDHRLKLIYSHLNGLRIGYGAAVKARASGARKGLPDLFLPVATNLYHGLYIELKRVKGGIVSPEQKKWLFQLGQQGYYATVCKGADEAIDVITTYLTTNSF